MDIGTGAQTATAATAERDDVLLAALSDADLSARLSDVYAAEQRLAAQRLQLIAEIDGRGQPRREGATSTVMWLCDKLRVKGGTAAAWVRLARDLAGGKLAATAEALSQARVNTEQAAVIAHAIATLPSEIGLELRDKAQQVLLGYATQFEPRQLAALGSRVLEHIAPEIAEQHELEALRQADKRAHRERAFTLTPQSDRRVRLSGWLDTESAAIVNAAISPLCSPTANRAHATGNGDERTAAQRRADALVEICQLALRCGQLPAHGGEAAHLIVTMPFEPWRDATNEAAHQSGGVVKTGRFDDGEPVTPETLRRMACDAAIMPVVLGGHGQVLDVGRTRRLFTGAIRKALIARDGGCCFPSCDRPPRWAEGHHIVPWHDGGTTSLDSGALLCRHHHRLVHEGGWQIRLGSDKLPEFIPPSYLDPLRRPLRNEFHRRT